MSDIGGIVENPEFYKYMTGMQNLRQYARMRGGIDDKRIDEVVEIVGLKNRINDKVKKYSLGMRQRLGVAQAILCLLYTSIAGSFFPESGVNKYQRSNAVYRQRRTAQNSKT